MRKNFTSEQMLYTVLVQALCRRQRWTAQQPVNTQLEFTGHRDPVAPVAQSTVGHGVFLVSEVK
jgi:hypothetical protein